MVPSARISIQESRGFDGLSPVLASLAFEGIVGLAKRVLVELEKLSQRIDREVTFGILFLVDNGRGQGLLVGLSLEDLLFDCSCRNEAINKTWREIVELS